MSGETRLRRVPWRKRRYQEGAHQTTERIDRAYPAANIKVRKVIKRIEADGWFHVRTVGDHRQYHHPRKPRTVTVAGKLSDEVPPGTLNSILRQAGLKGESK